jgi:AcrR family transcriptional regulator
MSDEEIVKEKILSSCRERFFKEGFAKTSVDEIAADLTISKKTFYKHFENKEDVVQQIMERVMESVRGNIDRILFSDRSAVEKLSEIIVVLATNTSRLTPAFGRDIKRRLPDFWNRIEDFRRQRISDVFNILIAQGITEGTMRPDMNKRVFLMCVLASIDRIMQPDIIAHESFSVGDAVKEIMSIFFAGALTPQGRIQFDQLRSTFQHHSI